jgi:hypothetical protein
MKLFYLLLLILMAGFFGLIGWMNATPGHFQVESQDSCCPVKVRYIKVAKPQMCRMYCGGFPILEKALLSLSTIDFNR